MRYNTANRTVHATTPYLYTMAMWILQEGEADEGGDDGEVVTAEELTDVAAETAVSLETVVEEDDDEDQQLRDQQNQCNVHESVDSNENTNLQNLTAPVGQVCICTLITTSWPITAPS